MNTPSRAGVTAALPGASWLLFWSLGAFVWAPSATAQTTFDRAQFLEWGLDVYQETASTLRLPRGLLFAETAHLNGTQSGGWNGKAFAWPHSAQFRVYNSLARFDAATFAPALRHFSDRFHTDFWSAAGGYYCCHQGGDRFYDDNSHIAVALAEAYEITGEPLYLDRARATFDFLLTGEAPGANGGSYWSVADHSFLDTTSALQGARAALMIYKATGEAAYLAYAERRYNWARDTTQLPGGTFMEKLYLTGPKAGQIGDFDLVHYAGYGISANVLFYDVTGEQAYLEEAQRIAARSIPRYFDSATGRINDEGFWAYELVDGLVDLYVRDGDTRWLDAVGSALVWLHDHKEDPQGHYGLFWGRGGAQNTTLAQWNLNDQAPVARAYLQFGLARRLADFDANYLVNNADYDFWENSFGQSVFPGSGADANGDGVVDAADYTIWRDNFSASLVSQSLSTSVPEPSTIVLVLSLFCMTRRRCRRQ